MTSLLQPLKTVIPTPVRRSLRSLITASAYRIKHFGLSHYCPICRLHLRRFLPSANYSDKLDVCPSCRCQGRHRLLWLYFHREKWLFARTPTRLLHIAPEKPFTELFCRMRNVDYVSADLEAPHVMVRMDITAIPYPDDSFDAIVCNHVLEHIPEDRKAMQELHRVLRPGGWAILLVPLTSKQKTYEDWSIQTPEGRQKAFGQHDHVRIYGTDYQDRLKSVGFLVRVDDYARKFPNRVIHRLKLQTKPLFLCQKPVV